MKCLNPVKIDIKIDSVPMYNLMVIHHDLDRMLWEGEGGIMAYGVLEEMLNEGSRSATSLVYG